MARHSVFLCCGLLLIGLATATTAGNQSTSGTNVTTTTQANSTTQAPAVSRSGLSTEQQDVLSVLRTVASSISLIGSFLVVLTYILFKDVRKFAFKLVFFLSLSELGWYLVSSLPQSIDKSVSCQTIAVFTSFFNLASVLWTTVISYVLNLTLTQPRAALNVKKSELKFHFFVWGFSLILTLAPMLTDSYGGADFLCWIVDDQLGTMWRFMQFYVPLWMAMAYNGRVYYRMTRKLRDVRSRAGSTQGRTLMFYPIVLVVCWTFPSINRFLEWISPGSAYMWLFVLQVLLMSLQGFFHSCLYLSTPIIRAHWKHILQCRSLSELQLNDSIQGGEGGEGAINDHRLVDDNFPASDDFVGQDVPLDDDESKTDQPITELKDVSYQIRSIWMNQVGMYELMGMQMAGEDFQMALERRTSISSLTRRSEGALEDEEFDGGDVRARSRTLSTSVAKVGVRATYFTLFKGFIGLGILTLPSAFDRAGYVGGSLGIIGVSVTSYHCMLLLLKCKEEVLRRVPDAQMSFGAIGYAAMGPLGQNMVDFFIVVSQCGFASGYLIFIGENFHDGLYEQSEGNIDVPKYMYIFLSSLLLLPFVYMKNLKKLAPTALIADFVIIFGLVVVLVGACISIRHGLPSEVVPFSWNTYPLFFGLTVSAFEGIGIIIPVEQSMKEPKRFPSILRNLMIAFTFLFISFGSIGYMAWGDSTKSIVLMNLPHNGLTLSTQLLYCVGIFFTYPIALYPANQILEALKCYQSLGCVSNPNIKRCLFRTIVVVVCTLTAVYTPNFGLFLNVIGAFACNALSFILPSLFYLRLFADQITPFQRFRTWFIVAFGFIAGGLCLVLAIMEFFK